MCFSIAITGKGGTGKTSISSLIIKWLIENGHKPLLAVDADPNSNLNEMLGIEMSDTVGNVREKLKDDIKDLPPGLSKLEFVEYKINTSLVEQPEFDFIAMGRPEGIGCYCYPNHMLQWALNRLINYYPFMVIDNEAGLENLSRRIVHHINLMLMISDPSVRGIKTAGRITDIMKDVNITADKTHLIINRLRNGELPRRLKEEVEARNLDLAGILPVSEEITNCDLEGKPIYDIETNTRVYRAIDGIMKKLM